MSNNNDALQAKLEGHEKLDHEIHGSIKARLSRIELGIVGTLVSVIVGMASIMWQLVQLRVGVAPVASLMEILK
jgi:uncharacterized membrane protein